jgi:phosphoglycolate phosphatase-like HAD superfamily hydrolase
MPIILFDIDGTLVRTAGAGKAAMEAGLRTAFGVTEIHNTVSYSGRTDVDISGELLRVHGFQVTPENRQALLDAYLARLPETLKRRPGAVCPGIHELLAAVANRPGVVLGLLTGNVRAGARLKLGHYGLWDFFACGGFGDDHTCRDDVARSALVAVREHVGGEVNPSDVWVIGDTPLDVRCARAIGANAVAVATGWHPLEELAGCAPDLIFDDLSDHTKLLAAWG